MTEKILEHEMLLSMEKRMTFFEPGGIRYENGKPFYHLTLKNIGKKAFKIKTTNDDSILVKDYEDSCGTGGELRINIEYLAPFQTISRPFVFEIHFFDNLNIAYFQIIRQLGPVMDYEISEPKRLPR